MKKIWLLLMTALIMGIIFPQHILAVKIQHVQPNSQATTTTSKIFKTVSPMEAKELIAGRQDIVLVDIRSPHELGNGTIEGSTFIPLWDILKRKQSIPQGKPVMLICAVGGRSLALGKLLSSNGYSEIYNLKGGIAAWKDAGLPLKY